MRFPRLSPMLFLLALVGCVSGRTNVEHQAQITIDIPHMRAASPQWQSELVDCSDATQQCIEAPGRFIMSFPRSCPEDVGSWIRGWSAAGYPFRLTAPDAHYPLPSGGYFSKKYPHAYLLYRADLGFTSLWMRANPVMSDNWGGSSLAEYGLRFVGGGSRFTCG